MQHIVRTPGVAGGKPRINGHRITVQNIAIWHERMGMSADEIATEYNLTLGQVYAALAYYHDHREEIEESIRADATFVEEMKQRHPSELAERLKALLRREPACVVHHLPRRQQRLF